MVLNNLKKLIEQNGTRVVSQKTGIPYTTICNYISDRPSVPDALKLNKIARIFETTSEWLIDGEEGNSFLKKVMTQSGELYSPPDRIKDIVESLNNADDSTLEIIRPMILSLKKESLFDIKGNMGNNITKFPIQIIKSDWQPFIQPLVAKTESKTYHDVGFISFVDSHFNGNLFVKELDNKVWFAYESNNHTKDSDESFLVCLKLKNMEEPLCIKMDTLQHETSKQARYTSRSSTPNCDIREIDYVRIEKSINFGSDV